MNGNKWIYVAWLFCLLGLGLHGQKGSKISKVVIDAGHGGKDPGALGGETREKDITLKVALKTGHYIRENLPDVEVIYTRSTDEFIPLHERTAIANKNQADVFISIHCNANKSSKPYGSETYVMGLHKDDANLNVAKTENAAILLEEDAIEQYEGFDPNSDIAYIIFSLYQGEYLQQSLELAGKVQYQFRERVGRRDRGVHQAGFLVLYRATMPSILVELGFLSNAAEEAFLNSEKGQVYMASAIYRAFKEFKIEFESENEHIQISPETNSSDTDSGSNYADLYYTVQFYSSHKAVRNYEKRFKKLPELSFYEHNGMIKYTSGHFSSFEKALEHQHEVQQNGYPDAFVVAFRDNQRIPVKEARKMTR